MSIADINPKIMSRKEVMEHIRFRCYDCSHFSSCDKETQNQCNHQVKQLLHELDINKKGKPL